MGQFLTVKDLILELANYGWAAPGKGPWGYDQVVLVKNGEYSVTEAGWVSQHEHNEGAPSPIIHPGPLPGGWKNSEAQNPYRRMAGLRWVRSMIDKEIDICQRELVLEDIQLGQIRGYRKED